MDSRNKFKLQELHNLLDKELQLLQQQLNTETEQGYLFKNSYLQRIKQASQAKGSNNDIASKFEDQNNNWNNQVNDEQQEYKKDYENNFQAYHQEPQNIQQKDQYQGNTQRLKQTFNTDYGTQISFQQRTSQFTSQNPYEGVETEQQQALLINNTDESCDPFTNFNLQKEINGLQQKIQFLEQKFIQQTNEQMNNNNKYDSLKKNNNKYDLNIQNYEQAPKDEIFNKNIKPVKNNDGFTKESDTDKYLIENKQNEINKNKLIFDQLNDSVFQQTSKSSQGYNHSRLDFNANQTTKRQNNHDSKRLNDSSQETKSNKKYFQKMLPNNAEKNDNASTYSQSKSPKNILKKRSISSKSSKTVQQDDQLRDLEKEIKGAEHSLDISKKFLKQALSISSSRLNLKTDSAVNKSNYSFRQQGFQDTSSKRSYSQKSQRERSLSQGANFFPIDSFAQQYHESLELKQKIAQIRKQYETEKDILNEERERNKVINESIDNLSIKIKKIQMIVERNQQNEKDYQKLIESYNKSEQIRKQQKLLILQLKEEIEVHKSNQNKSPISIIQEEPRNSRKKNGKRLSTSGSQNYPKRI
ncbi:hypothetical protein TTHERM_00220680 (macronuclear) [Tetrahymena thermophila SB210]|uniref:Uncharacterized protein n=1 Tax=Tetrahymena thermophila (strain SB210) TaxID=312017 RepID=I7M2H4_TETTS|nr:hypothetical protein TTHERM_00220680 [Tetrahymena thermophila SB210]EAS00395.2 hypothetical protein TTHERM_00220680 [Tetrahymena thermophila SB210]|eukprot:XP_001020640.2 hypothetical protein TTHERM_00220680 [Tetrahymena thermophila SB210]